jgi:hypothetical protein
LVLVLDPRCCLAVACGVVAARPVPVPRFASARGRGRWHPVSMPPPPAVPPRFCKKCGVAFQGSKCPASHPIFQYTRKIPDGVTVPPAKRGGEASPDVPSTLMIKAKRAGAAEGGGSVPHRSSRRPSLMALPKLADRFESFQGAASAAASAAAATGPVSETELSAVPRERRAAQRMRDREAQMERRREVVRRVRSEQRGSGVEGVRLAVGAMRAAAQVDKAYKAMQKTAAAAEGEPPPSAAELTCGCIDAIAAYSTAEREVKYAIEGVHEKPETKATLREKLATVQGRIEKLQARLVALQEGGSASSGNVGRRVAEAKQQLAMRLEQEAAVCWRMSSSVRRLHAASFVWTLPVPHIPCQQLRGKRKPRWRWPRRRSDCRWTWIVLWLSGSRRGITNGPCSTGSCHRRRSRHPATPRTVWAGRQRRRQPARQGGRGWGWGRR